MPWLQPQLQQYGQMIGSGRLPHALSIEGPAGLGKTLLGTHLLHWLLCERPTATGACGGCAECSLLAAGQHPDQILIVPDSDSGRQITVSAIRGLRDRLALRPQRRGRQVALIVPAEAMNESSANALLKTLEEPSEDSHLILVTHLPARLPVTLLSRCVRSAISRPLAALTRQWLERQVPSGTDLDLLLSQCGGRPLQAIEAIESNRLAQWQRIRQWLDRCLAGQATPMAAARALADQPDLVLDFLSRLLEAEAEAELAGSAAKVGLTSSRRQSTLSAAWQACQLTSAQLGSGLRADLAMARVFQLCVQALVNEATPPDYRRSIA
jgi:DNA polymerase-3 subunit delta'